MNAWEDSTEAGSEWTDVLQTVEKILYECATAIDITFVSYAAKKLHQMLSRRKITNADEACYEIGRLNCVYKDLLQRGKHERSSDTFFSGLFEAILCLVLILCFFDFCSSVLWPFATLLFLSYEALILKASYCKSQERLPSSSDERL